MEITGSFECYKPIKPCVFVNPQTAKNCCDWQNPPSLTQWGAFLGCVTSSARKTATIKPSGAEAEAEKSENAVCAAWAEKT